MNNFVDEKFNAEKFRPPFEFSPNFSALHFSLLRYLDNYRGESVTCKPKSEIIDIC